VFGSLKALRRCEKLEEDLLRLKRDFLELQLEWTNTYDKIRTMMGRIAKRAEVVQRFDEAPAEEVGPAINANELLILNRLPPAQRAVQERILRNRRHMNGGA
jgi:hypothetical protein